MRAMQTILALPPLPPNTRGALDGTRSLALSRVLLFEECIIRAGQSTVGAARADLGGRALDAPALVAAPEVGL
jgi:hypothetical protein